MRHLHQLKATQEYEFVGRPPKTKPSDHGYYCPSWEMAGTDFKHTLRAI